MNIRENDFRDFFAKIIQHPRLMGIAVNLVELNDFISRDIWRNLYKAILDLNNLKVPCSFPNLNHKLREDLNTANYQLTLEVLRDVVAAKGVVLPFEYEEVIFKELCSRIVAYSVVDKMNSQIEDLQNPSVSKNYTSEQQLKNFNNAVDFVSMRMSKARDINLNYSIEKLEDVVNDYDTFIQEYANTDYGKGYGYGIPEADKLVRSGLKAGNLDLIAALTGVGKSWFSIHTAANCLIHRIGCLYFSLEMTKEETRARLMQAITYSNAPGYNKLEPDITRLEKFNMFKEIVQEAVRVGSPLDIMAYQAGTASIFDIEMGIKDYYTRYGAYPKVVIVDGIPNVKNEFKANITQGEKAIVQGLDSICKNLNIAILATHQLNRSAYGENSLAGDTISGSLDILRAASTVMTIQKHSVGNFHNLYKLKFIKTRHDSNPEGYIVFITNKQLGQFYVSGSDVYCGELKQKSPNVKEERRKETKKVREEGF